DPSRALWDMLTRYVQKGGNLVVVPGGDELKREAYNGEPAQQLLPGQLKELVAAEKPGVAWEQAGPHLLLEPFQEWRRSVANVDFLQPEYTPRALRYWGVEPAEAEGIIIKYADAAGRPALLERTVGAGKVLLFTTGFDGRRVKGQSEEF